MQLLANIALGACLAVFSLGPPAWAEVAQVHGRLLQAASQLAGGEKAPLAHAVTKARTALPDLGAR